MGVAVIACRLAQRCSGGWRHIPDADVGEVLAFTIRSDNATILSADLVGLVINTEWIVVARSWSLVFDIAALVTATVFGPPPTGRNSGTVICVFEFVANVSAAFCGRVPLALLVFVRVTFCAGVVAVWTKVQALAFASSVDTPLTHRKIVTAILINNGAAKTLTHLNIRVPLAFWVTSATGFVGMTVLAFHFTSLCSSVHFTNSGYCACRGECFVTGVICHEVASTSWHAFLLGHIPNATDIIVARSSLTEAIFARADTNHIPGW